MKAHFIFFSNHILAISEFHFYSILSNKKNKKCFAGGIYLALTSLVGGYKLNLLPDSRSRRHYQSKAGNALEEHFTSFSFSLVLFIFKTGRDGREKKRRMIMRQSEREKRCNSFRRDKVKERKLFSCYDTKTRSIKNQQKSRCCFKFGCF